MKISNIPQYFLLILRIKPNEILGFRILARLARYLTPSYRLTWPEIDWFKKESLTNILTQFEENNGFNAHRRLALQQLLRLIYMVPGDTAECGVYKGCSSYIILDSNSKSIYHRTHHIFDSFEGLSEPSESDGSHWKSNDLSVAENVVKGNLSSFNNYILYKGWIPDRFRDLGDRKFSFVHVDVDLYDPTLASIEFFYERLSEGGIFLCDDYGFSTCPGATAAIDKYLKNKPEKMICLPGGGGFFFKGCTTDPE